MEVIVYLNVCQAHMDFEKHGDYEEMEIEGNFLYSSPPRVSHLCGIKDCEGKTYANARITIQLREIKTVF